MITHTAASGDVVYDAIAIDDVTVDIIDNDPPAVTTTAVSNITDTTAVSGGNVTNQGGSSVTARGVCWSTAANPIVGGDCLPDDAPGLGLFTINITDLTANRLYYVRAYATNSFGTAYGAEVSFVAGVSTVTTTAVSNITATTADSGGDVTADAGATVTARGVCWNTTGTPTTADTCTSDGTGTGVYTSNITGLSRNTTYYVAAYATNSVGTGYGGDRSFTTLSGDRCPADPAKTSPGVCGCGVADTDSDGDGTPDCNDDCPNDPDSTVAGVCGCGVPDTDSDGDGTADCIDNCPDNPDKTEPGVYGCDPPDDGLVDETTVGEDGATEVSNDVVEAAVEGLEEGTTVTLVTDDSGTTTLTVTDPAGENVLAVSAEGFGAGSSIDVSMDASGNPSVTLTDASGTTLTVSAADFPPGIEVDVIRDDQGYVGLVITDESGAARTVLLEMVGADPDIVIDVVFNAAGQQVAQSVPGSDAAADWMADVDSVTLEADGLSGSAVITIALAYRAADYAGGDESALRLHRLDDRSGLYVPAGMNDVGEAPPSQTLGDYGVDTTVKAVWAQVNELGTFAVGIAERVTLPGTVGPGDTSDTSGVGACGAGGGMCGALGMICLPMTFLGMMAMRRRRR